MCKKDHYLYISPNISTTDELKIHKKFAKVWGKTDLLEYLGVGRDNNKLDIQETVEGCGMWVGLSK